MKLTMKFLALVIGMMTLMNAANAANAESPREQLQQLTAQLQNSPEDEALREKIIALALTLNPKPTTPDAVTMAEGAAEYAFKHALTNSDFSDAAKQYEKALLLAPWLADDYFNCGIAHEKAGENKEAIHSFNLYLLAAPNANDVQAIKKRIGGLQYATQKKVTDNAANTKAAAAAANVQADAESKKNAFIKSIQGNWSSGGGTSLLSINPHENGDAKITFHRYNVGESFNSGQYFAVSDINITESTLRFTADNNSPGNPESLIHYSLSLDGKGRLTGSYTDSLTESGRAMIRSAGWTPGADYTGDCSFIRQ